MDVDAKVWIDGEIVGIGEARVPVLDHGLLYGDGIFEGLRVYGGRVFRLADHLRRLATGARVLGLELPGGISALEKIVLNTARAYARPEAYVRLIVTRGEGELGVDPFTCPTPRVICIVSAISLFSEEKMRRGIDLVTVALRRPPPDVLDPAVKSLNYLNSVLAKREARLRGADEALLLNHQGMVAEAAVANVFMVRDGALRTPPVTDGALPGITRASVIELAEAAGLPMREVTLGRVDLFGADEVFLTGSGARIVPVASLDGEVIGEPACFPITRQLTEAFADYVLTRGTAF
jgi:branched-chain amino acid aminotransferase